MPISFYLYIVPQSAPVHPQWVSSPATDVQFISHNPAQMQCPRCRQEIVTNVDYEVGVGTWLIVFGIVMFGGIFGCCLIPFFWSACQDAVHSCPSCNGFIGRRNLI